MLAKAQGGGSEGRCHVSGVRGGRVRDSGENPRNASSNLSCAEHAHASLPQGGPLYPTVAEKALSPVSEEGTHAHRGGDTRPVPPSS